MCTTLYTCIVRLSNQKNKKCHEGGGLGCPTSIGEGNERQQERWASKGSGLWDPKLIGEENETLFIRV